MSKTDGTHHKSGNARWIVTVFIMTIIISATIQLISEQIMSDKSMITTFLILILIVLVGIVFDIIGMAVATADEKPFHSMAARKVTGAAESIRLLRKAERVSSICCDVVGDICGVVGGSASATVAAMAAARLDIAWPQAMTLALSAFVAGLTVGGKALGKTYAINSCTQIVHTVGRLLYTLRRIPRLLSKNKS